MQSLPPFSVACRAMGISKSTGYARVKAGLLTKPIRVSKRLSSLPDFEVEAIQRALIAGASDDEIRRLVADLMAARQAGAQREPAAPGPQS